MNDALNSSYFAQNHEVDNKWHFSKLNQNPKQILAGGHYQNNSLLKYITCWEIQSRQTKQFRKCCLLVKVYWDPKLCMYIYVIYQ